MLRLIFFEILEHLAQQGYLISHVNIKICCSRFLSKFRYNFHDNLGEMLEYISVVYCKLRRPSNEGKCTLLKMSLRTSKSVFQSVGLGSLYNKSNWTDKTETGFLLCFWEVVSKIWGWCLHCIQIYDWMCSTWLWFISVSGSWFLES